MSTAPHDLLGTTTTTTTTSLARQLGLALGPAVATAAWALSGYTPAGMRGAVVIGAGLSVLGVAALIGTRQT